MIMRETERAYLAGLLDADGCIFISSRGYLHVTIASVNREFLQYWREVTGAGNIYDNGARWSNGRHVFKWIINGNYACEFLREIWPYLVLKREQAQVTIGAFDNGDPAVRVKAGNLLKRMKRDL